MLSLPSTLRIFLAVEPADMRKGFDGLSQLVRDRIAPDRLAYRVARNGTGVAIDTSPISSAAQIIRNVTSGPKPD